MLLEMQNKKDYDTMCIFYLGIQIMKAFEVKFLCIDFYYDKIKEIYEDYKKYDNGNKSLLDSVNDYIDNNKQEIYEKVKHCFE